MSQLDDALKLIDGQQVHSGGCVPYADMKLFEKIGDDEAVVFYHTDWLPTSFPDEQKQVIIFQRVRKVKPLGD